MKLGSDFDFDQNQGLNLVLHNAITSALTTAMTVMGQMGFDTTQTRAVLFDGSAVRKILLDLDIDTNTALGSSDVKIPSQKAIKTYVDSLVAAGQSPFVDFDASTATQFPAGATLGSRYRVTVGGTVQGVTLQAMDVFWPRVASPGQTTSTDWVFIQGNVDVATTSTLGLVLLATLSEIQANLGQNANKVITVAQLNAWEAALGRVRKYSNTQSIVVGANAITHNLGTSTPQVQAFDSTGPILYQWTVTSANAISITASKAKTGVTITIQG